MKDENAYELGRPYLMLLVAIGMLMIILARDGGVLILGGTAIALAVVMWPMVTHDPQRILAWWRKRPAVIARRRRRQAARLAKLNERAQLFATSIEHLRKIMRDIPEDADIESVRSVTNGYGDPRIFFEAHLLNTRLFSTSPLVHWMWEWVLVETSHMSRLVQPWWRETKSGSIRWEPGHALALALKVQHEEWQVALEKLLKQTRKLQLEIYSLSAELGVESQNYLEPEAPRIRSEAPVESKRDKLARLREEADKLEDEILAEEQEAASGPHRRAAGVSGRD